MLAQPDHQVLTPCSPFGARRGARRLPKGWCPPALITIEDGVCGVEAAVVQEQPLLSPPLKKTSLMGCLPPSQLNRAKEWGETLRHNSFCLVGWPRGP